MIEKRTKNGWFLDEICGQMYVYLTLYAICGVEIYEYRDFYVAHGIFLSTEHTEDTEKIIVEDYFQDFILDLPIGYFGHDSAKNKFLDLFSALAAPKIRAVGDPQLNPPQKQRTVAHFQLGFLLKILFSSILNDILFLAIGHIFIKDFLQRFTYGLFCRDSA